MELMINVETYLQEFADGCPEERRPKYCKYCDAERIFHRHGKYERHVIIWMTVLLIYIFRFRCSICKHTQSVRPSFVGPHQQVTWDVIEEVVKKNEEGTSLNDIAKEIVPPVGPYSERTLWRWKKTWEELLDRHSDFMWEWFLKRVPHLCLPVGAEKPKTNRGYLFRIFEQAKAWMPEIRPYRLFHWLSQLLKSLAVTVLPTNPT